MKGEGPGMGMNQLAIQTWWMLKGPPVNPRDYISRTSKISPREGR